MALSGLNLRITVKTDPRTLAMRRDRLGITQVEMAKALGVRSDDISRFERALEKGGMADRIAEFLARAEG